MVFGLGPVVGAHEFPVEVDSRYQANNNAGVSLAGAWDSVVPSPSPERDDPSSLVGPSPSLARLPHRQIPRFGAGELKFLAFSGPRSSAVAMGAEIAVIKAQDVAYDSSVPHDGVI